MRATFPMRMLHRKGAGRKGLTLLELAATMVVASIVGGSAYYFLSAALNLFAQNYSLNLTNLKFRTAIDQVRTEIHRSTGAPVLVNASGTPVGGNGPAAGIRFERSAGGPYTLDAPAQASTKSILVQRKLPLPQPGQVIAIVNPVVRAPILSVEENPDGNTQLVRLHFAANFGTYANPSISTGVVAGKGIPLSLVANSYLIAQKTGREIQLRFYENGLSSTPKNLVELNAAESVNETPFQLVSTGGRTVASLDASVRVTDYMNRQRPFSNYLRVSTTFHNK
jgi:hypothetical protein